LNLSPVLEELSLKAVPVVGADYVGVDILSSVEGQRYVIDVNGIPGWRGQQMTTDIDIADRIVKQVLGTL